MLTEESDFCSPAAPSRTGLKRTTGSPLPTAVAEADGKGSTGDGVTVVSAYPSSSSPSLDAYTFGGVKGVSLYVARALAFLCDADITKNTPPTIIRRATMAASR